MIIHKEGNETIKDESFHECVLIKTLFSKSFPPFHAENIYKLINFAPNIENVDKPISF